jgi:hypothetical protein
MAKLGDRGIFLVLVLVLVLALDGLLSSIWLSS